MVLTRTDLEITRHGIDRRVTGVRPEYATTAFVMPDLLAGIVRRTGLARSTVGKILLESGRLDDALNHPQAFIDQVSALLTSAMKELLVEGVEYQKIGDQIYEMRRFEDGEIETFLSNVHQVQEPDKTLFSHIVIDGDSSPERRFAEDCEANHDVLFYFKLPRWFVIDTPVGEYNPDWALVLRGDQTLYFVAETKSTGEAQDPAGELLRPIERMKLECGRRHFKQFEEVRFRRVASLGKWFDILLLNYYLS